MPAWALSTASVLFGLFGLLSALHALLRKRDHRSALGWVVVCLWIPLFGGLLYWSFGVNRIKRRALRLRGSRRAGGTPPGSLSSEGMPRAQAERVRLSDIVARQPLLAGNRVEPLYNGEEAFPAMLDAIGTATRRVSLVTYILQRDATGRLFVEALAEAHRRGVEVRVLIDGIGEWYSPRRIGHLFEREGVPFARFLPPSWLSPGLHMNLRNHRKILVVDGEVGFTGGMNFHDGHRLASAPEARAVRDVHFRVQGPVVSQLEETFFEDWGFATGDRVSPEARSTEFVGDSACRGIASGPDEEFEQLHWILVGAVSSAETSVAIMTPYFLPNRELIGALCTAALRGVRVDVLLPSRNNLPVVAWATQAMLWEFLDHGVHLWMQPGCFDHTKLFVVDGRYALVGSTNLDPRSLRLNFEFNLEVLGEGFGGRMMEYLEERRAGATRLTRSALDRRSLPTQIRDAAARLFTPYL